MGKIETFLINCGLRKAIGVFSNHSIEMHQITSLSERQLEVLFPIIGELQKFKAALKRKRIEENVKKRKRDANGWIVENLGKITKKRMRSNGTKRLATAITKGKPKASTSHSRRVVQRILKTDETATSDLLETVNEILASHSKSLKVDSWRDLFHERPLIDFKKGKLNCPACSSQITPYLRRLSPICWQAHNFKRHLDEFHAVLESSLEESSADKNFTATVDTVMDSSDDTDWSESDNLPIKSFGSEKLNNEQVSIEAVQSLPLQIEHMSNGMLLKLSAPQSSPVRTTINTHLSLEVVEEFPKEGLQNETLPVQSLPHIPLPSDHSTNGMLRGQESSQDASSNETLPVQSLMASTGQLPNFDGLEFPLNEYTDDGHQCYSSLMRGGLRVNLGDTVYILRDVEMSSNSESESTPTPRKHTYKTIGEIPYTECDIFRVEQLWKDDEGNRFAFGHHYLRPHETFYKASKKFYANELVSVALYENLPIDLIMGQCWVLDPRTFCKGRPIHSKEDHVYICELKVNKARQIFSKISKQDYPVCTKPFAFKNFDVELKITRNYSVS